MRGNIFGVLVFAAFFSANAASVWDSYFCQAEKDGTTDKTAVNPCDNTCPAIVKTDGVIKKAADLPIDGWWIFSKKAKGLYTSPLKQFTPTLIPNTGSDVVVDMDISDDGQWILYVTNNLNSSEKQRINLIRRDGTGKVTLETDMYTASWFHASPQGTEIAYTTTPYTSVKVWAVKVNLSGSKPVFGTTRKIGENLGGYAPIHYGNGEFSVRKNHIFIRMRVGKEGSSLLHAGMLYTIPDNGNGMATSTHLFKPRFGFNCGMDMYKDGTMIVENNARSYADCIIDWHAGFHVLPVKDYNDPTPSAFDWFLGQGVSINWAPKSMRDPNTLDMHNTHWSNQKHWIAITNIKTLTTDPHGTFIVNWSTNEWYRLSGTNIADADRAYNPAPFITTQVGVADKDIPGSPARTQNLRVVSGEGTITISAHLRKDSKLPVISILDLSGAKIRDLDAVPGPGSGVFSAKWKPRQGTAGCFVAQINSSDQTIARPFVIGR